ncbi:MAG: pilus assembly PilX N-terminal domain-containing protein [Deltaproteobacteria bacterium]|nr:pilus assembly PilX N-terminal domain-containing protein [Deltaproteobacteria bacterium]
MKNIEKISLTLLGRVKRFIGQEKGFALVLTIVIMASMSAIGIAAITTSNTDLHIARNQKEARVAFFLAEMGIDEAIARMDLNGDDPRFIGETTDDKSDRMDGLIDELTSNNYVSSADLGIADIGGTYEAFIDYAKESQKTWCRDSPTAADDADHCSDEELIVYCEEFMNSGTDTVPASCNFAVPVFVIESTGATSSGTSVTLTAYVTASIWNVLPPGDTILFSEESIEVAGVGCNEDSGGKIIGRVASTIDNVCGCLTPIEDAADAGVDDPCDDVSGVSISDDWNDGDMNCFIGICMNEIANYADVVETQAGTNAITYHPGTGDASDWGQVCSDATDPDHTAHICDSKESKIVVIENDGAGPAKLLSATGRGLLIIQGDLELAGNLVWEGMIYVMGTLKITGDVTVYGTLMIDGDDDNDVGDDDVWVNGSLAVYGSSEVATSVIDGLGVPRVLRWTRFN